MEVPPGKVILHSIRKQAVKPGSKPVSNVLPWFLFQLLLLNPCFESFP